jgi:hypothetical protein
MVTVALVLLLLLMVLLAESLNQAIVAFEALYQSRVPSACSQYGSTAQKNRNNNGSHVWQLGK